MKELITIQSELKAPKSQFNRFGGYKYRKAEDILEAVKPLLAKEKCTLVLTDDIVSVGNRIYVKSLATLKNNSGETEMSVGYAREEEKNGRKPDYWSIIKLCSQVCLERSVRNR